jgi:DnaA family protein
VKQLALALSSPPEPTFDNFVTGRNAELVASLRAFASGTTAERFVYLWGGVGSGRSHLLAATARAGGVAGRDVVLVSAPADHSMLAASEYDRMTVIVDDVDRLDAEAQIALFALYNRIRDGGIGALLCAGEAAPAGLDVRADLATRLAWGLVYEVQALSDEEKAAAMRSHAAARGFTLPDDVQDYMLRHARRDLPSLLMLIESLDRYSLEEQRPITVPLARDVLQQMQ